MTRNTALIFGATGSIGNYILEELKKDNVDVIGTTTNSNKITLTSDNIILVTSDNQASLKNIYPKQTLLFGRKDVILMII